MSLAFFSIFFTALSALVGLGTLGFAVLVVSRLFGR